MPAIGCRRRCGSGDQPGQPNIPRGGCACIRIMTEKLSIRIDPRNPDHHLWNNNGTWWLHCTVHEPGNRVRRVRFSLHTADLEAARARRDLFFTYLEVRGNDVEVL